MLTSRACLALLLAGLLFTACGQNGSQVADGGADGKPDGESDGTDGTDGADGTDAPFVPASEYCQRTADFFCAYYLRCGRMAVADQESCQSAFLETCQGIYLPRYVDLESAGLLKLSTQGIQSCREHLAQVACLEQVFDLDGACSAVWQGTQQAGQSCSIGLESFVCAPGTHCVVGMDLCGECRTIVGPGESCSADLGTTCGPSGTCRDQICTPRIPAGQACTPDDTCALGTRCQDDEICRDDPWVGLGQTCDAQHSCAYLSHCSSGTCLADLLLDAPCQSSDVCASGRCLAGTCQPLAQDEQPCQSAYDCASGFCVEEVCAAGPSACIAP